MALTPFGTGPLVEVRRTGANESDESSDNARILASLNSDGRALLQYASDSAVERALALTRQDQSQAAQAVHDLFKEAEASRAAGHAAVMRAGRISEEHLLQLLDWAQANYASQFAALQLESATKAQQQEIALKESALKATAHIEDTRVELEHKIALAQTDAKRQVFSVHEHVEKKSLDTDKATSEAITSIRSRLADLERQLTARIDDTHQFASTGYNTLRSTFQARLGEISDQTTSQETSIWEELAKMKKEWSAGSVVLKEHVADLRSEIVTNLEKISSESFTRLATIPLLRDRVGVLETQLAAQKVENESLRSELNALQKTLNDSLATMSARLDGVDAELGRVKPAVRSIIGEVRALDQKVDDLKITAAGKVSAQTRSTQELEAAMEAVRQDISKLHREMSTARPPLDDSVETMRLCKAQLEDFKQQMDEKFASLEALSEEKRLSESRAPASPHPPITVSKSPRARNPLGDIADEAIPRPAHVTPQSKSVAHDTDPSLFDCGETMKVVVRREWFDSRKRDVLIYEYEIGRALADLPAPYNFPMYLGKGLASQEFALIAHRVAERFGSSDPDSKLVAEISEIAKRERYTSDALFSALGRPEHGRQSLCEILTALTSTDPVRTMSLLRRARIRTGPASPDEFILEATGAKSLRAQVPGLGECEQRLTGCFDRMFQRDKGSNPRGSRGGQQKQEQKGEKSL